MGNPGGCVHCNAKLGENHLLPEFPVGKRLAYDPADARLWVVCPKCERWNLAWLDEPERQAAVQRLEQYFAAAPDKTDAGGISVAEVAQTSLIRIGAAPWPTFAFRRYARRLAERRRWSYTYLAVMYGALVFMYTPQGHAFLEAYGLTFALVFVVSGSILAIHFRTRASVATPDGQLAKVNIQNAISTAIHADAAGWHLVVETHAGVYTLQGAEAARALSLLLSAMNDGAGTRKLTAEAIALIERAGDPKRFLADVLSVRTLGPGARFLTKIPMVMRLAIEIALNEEAERAALRGQLAAVAIERDSATSIASEATQLGSLG